MHFFEKKLAIFRDFSGRFVIFNIEVNKLEIRKISPFFKPVLEKMKRIKKI